MPAYLNTDESRHLFSEATGHVAVPLERLKSGRVVWINEAYRDLDPQAHSDTSPEDYRRHILDRCAFVTAIPRGANELIGIADRYGGSGIGHNGGSGRAAFVNGYHLKGIGRTPLLSPRALRSHASGTSSLNASIREAIYSSIARSCFHHSAIPVLAIIATGTDDDRVSRSQSRAILVRPCFIRAAHFERAVGFISANHKEGLLDSRRVSSFFASFRELFSDEVLTKAYMSFFDSWARQLACSFVQRLPHGANTTSNISIHGELLDFGSMSSVPSWANFSTMLRPLPLSDLFTIIERAHCSLAYYFSRHFSNQLGARSLCKILIEQARHTFKTTLLREILINCGISIDTINKIIECNGHGKLLLHTSKLLKHYQMVVADAVNGLRPGVFHLDLGQVWAENPPSHLRELRSCLSDFCTDIDEAAASSQTRCLPFENLQRERLRSEIVRLTDQVFRDDQMHDAMVKDFIERTVAARISVH